MRLSIIKSCLLFSILSFSTASFAINSTNDTIVPSAIALIQTAPVQGIWTLGLEGSYVNSGAGPAYTQKEVYGPRPNFFTPPPLLATLTLFENPGFQWSGTVNLDYQLANTGADFNLVYTYLNITAQNANYSSSPSVTYAITILPNGNDPVVKNYFSELVNIVDLLAGLHIAIIPRVDLHPFAGMRYTNLNLHNKSTFLGFNPSILTPAWIITNNSRFSGAGPRAGIDTTVQIAHGFSAIAAIGISILVGNQSIDASVDEPGHLSLSNNFETQSQTVVTPEIDFRLGAGYTYYFSHAALNLQAGYEMVNYFNILNFTQNIVSGTDENSSNFMYQGSFMRAQISFK